LWQSLSCRQQFLLLIDLIVFGFSKADTQSLDFNKLNFQTTQKKSGVSYASASP
jgi:hypothetical protein